MSKKSWHLDRRTFLLGTGASLALPYLECMAADSATTVLPKRMCGIYFPFGVSLPKADSEQAKWRWFPNGEGKDYEFNESLKPLESFRESLTILGGLSHPHGRKMGAHDTGDTFLTGALLEGTHWTTAPPLHAAPGGRIEARQSPVGCHIRYRSHTSPTNPTPVGRAAATPCSRTA